MRVDLVIAYRTRCRNFIISIGLREEIWLTMFLKER